MNDLNLNLDSILGGDMETPTYSEYVDTHLTVGGSVETNATPAQTADLTAVGKEILASMSQATMDARKETSLNTKWISTILDKEPLRDADGNYIDEDKISTKAIGYRMLINGVEQVMTKEALQAFVAEQATETLGDPSTGEPCLRLTSRSSKTPKNGVPKLPVFSFKALGGVHTLTKHKEQWDCVEFAREPEMENGEYKKKPVPAQAKASKENDPSFVEKTYIVYKWKDGYEVFKKGKSEGSSKNQASVKAFQLLLAVRAQNQGM